MNRQFLVGLWLRLRAWLLRPVTNVDDRIHDFEARVISAEKHALAEIHARAHLLLVQLSLVVAAALLAVVGAVYCLIGMWLGVSRLLGATAASITLGVLFLLAAAVPWMMLRRMRRATATLRPMN